MTESSIAAMADGPYLVRGPLTIVGVGGEEHAVEAGQTVTLCRCGLSQRKPLCDRSHRAAGFEAHEPWPDPA